MKGGWQLPKELSLMEGLCLSAQISYPHRLYQDQRWFLIQQIIHSLILRNLSVPRKRPAVTRWQVAHGSVTCGVRGRITI